jgi:hypothetical protein
MQRPGIREHSNNSAPGSTRKSTALLGGAVHRFQLSICLISLALATAATAAPPTTALVEKELVELAATTSKGILVISNFKRTDGEQLPDGRYAVDFHATFTFRTSNCSNWVPGGRANREQHRAGFYMMGLFVRDRPGHTGCLSNGGRIDVNRGDYFSVSPGHTGSASGRAIVVMKESGWRVSDAFFYIEPGTVQGNQPVAAPPPSPAATTASVTNPAPQAPKPGAVSAPSATTQSTPTSPSKPLQSEIVGTWSWDRNDSRRQTAPSRDGARFSFQVNSSGQLEGTADYHQYQCQSSLSLLQATHDVLTFRETPLKKGLMCSGKKNLRVERDSSGTVTITQSFPETGMTKWAGKPVRQ